MDPIGREKAGTSASSAGEDAWFECFDAADFEDDGRHVLNGLPRDLSELADRRGGGWLESIRPGLALFVSSWSR